MVEKDKEELFFRELMSENLLKVPSPGFDDKVIGLLKKRIRQKAVASRNKKLAWVFFIAGSILGIIFILTFPAVGEQIPGIDINNITMVLQGFFPFVFTLQLYNLLNFRKESHFNNHRRLRA